MFGILYRYIEVAICISFMKWMISNDMVKSDLNGIQQGLVSKVNESE